MTLVSFQGADDIGDRFLSLLSKHEIEPPVRSLQEHELLSLTQLIEITKNPALASEPEKVAVLRAAAGLHDLAAKVLSVEPITEFGTFIPHLRLIANAKARAASLGQNAASAYDSPTNAKGDNPDVMVTLERDDTGEKQRWALAIKTISSTQGQTIYERIKNGADQVDDPKCLADRGMVVINVKDALDHDKLWKTEFPDLASAMTALGAQIDGLIEAAEKDRPQAEWDALFKRKVARPILFLGQSLVRLPTPASKQTPTALKMLKVYGANGELDQAGAALAHCMNHLMQTILRGIPGSTGNPPS